MAVERTQYGTWRARWIDDTGKQRARSFKRKVDAQRFLDDTRSSIGRGTYVTVDRTTSVRDWADQWLTGARNLGAGGRDTYRRDLDAYILPAIGDLPLAKLTADHVDELLTDELERLAPSTVARHYRTIRRMCQVAVERRKIPFNPCDPVKPPPVEHAEMKFLTVDQVDALADSISARYRAWVYVAAYGGLRWSETVGLRRRNITGSKIVVVEQLVKRASGWDRSKPKTNAGRRTVSMPAFAVDLLGQHLEQWSQPGADGLVFVNQRDAALLNRSFAGNVFKPALKRAGIPEIRIHDLRHTAAALAIAVGAHPKAIQVRLGHRSITTTLDRYGHLFPEIDENIAVELDALRAGDRQVPEVA